MSREDYQEYKRLGLCPMCHGGGVSRPGRAYCDDCLERKTRIRDAVVAQWGCTYCWKASREPGHLSCNGCRIDAARRQAAARLEANPALKRRSCTGCGEPGHYARTCTSQRGAA